MRLSKLDKMVLIETLKEYNGKDKEINKKIIELYELIDDFIRHRNIW